MYDFDGARKVIILVVELVSWTEMEVRMKRIKNGKALGRMKLLER